MLTIDDFAPRAGETFTATAEGGRTLRLELILVEPLPNGFSLEFVDSVPEHVPQQTVAVQHPELGDFALFVVPLGPGERGMRYQAVFS